ncbi:hypothetical protein PG984_016140 [Apiospora sp. TS-2023a]
MEPCLSESKGREYEYAPLPSRTHLRRCIIQPDEYENPVTITIDVVEFKTAIPVYEALSYVWGTENDPLQVLVDCSNGERRSLSVTQNLHVALRNLRRPDSPRIMWIDAICINQNDDVEKGPQVGMMDKIYKRATRVVAWLGPEADESGLAMSLIGSLGSQVKVDFYSGDWEPRPVSDDVDPDLVDLTKPLDFYEDEFRSLAALLQRPWLTRLWIRQDIFLANQQAIICCGKSQVPWSSLRNSLLLFRGKPRKIEAWGPEQSTFKSRIRPMGGFIYQFREIRIDELRNYFNLAECKDKQVRVFAVKGMLEDGSSEDLGVTPDYTKTYEDVYTDAVQRSAAHFNSLDIIGQCELSNIETGSRLPSWVPDRSQKSALERFELGALASSHLAPLYEYTTDTQKQQRQRVLRVLGVATTVVQTTGPIVERLKVKTPTSCRHNVRTLLAGVRADRHHPPTIDGASAHDYTEVMRELLMGTLTTDSAAGNPGLSLAINIYSENLVGRRLGWDARDVPVLCPGPATSGDQVSILVGCMYPMLLRSLATDRESQRYVVVGPCVTVDTCDGEAMLGLLPDGTRVAKIATAQWEFGFVTQSTGEVSLLDPRLAEEGLLGPDVESGKTEDEG